MRSTWQSSWREMASYIQPRRQRFFTSEAQTAGQKKESNVINGTPMWALRTLAAGMMAGITSPARPWFRLSTVDPDLAEVPDAKAWLHVCEQRMLDAMSQSNFYDALQTHYLDLGLFGTAGILLEEDPITYFRAYVLPIGEFFLAQSDRGEIDTLYHDTARTVEQLIRGFGRDNCSDRLKNAYDQGNLDELIDVVHVVTPREHFDPKSALPKNMPFASLWFEKTGDAIGALRESGYRENPILAPRWSVVGNDVYGAGPGFEALGDAKALQEYEKSKARATEILVDPPLNLPSADRNRNVSLLPGARNWVTGPAVAEASAPALTIDPRGIQEIRNDIREHETRVKTAFYADLFLMLAEDERAQPVTAREVQERHEEKLLQLGPVMERLENELLDPAVERIFSILLRAKRLPKPPKALQGQPLQVKYLSIMAQAQKSIAVAGLQQFAGIVQNVAAAKPEVMDNVDIDQYVDEVADGLGINPAIVVPRAKVAQIRGQRAQQQAQEAQQQQALAVAQSAKTLSQANTGGQNALSQMLGGVASAQGGLQ